MSELQPVKILFVCMGNICRSPTAQGLFQQMIREQGLDKRILVDSAGTHSYHIGNPPDSRSQAVARRRGIDLSKLRSRRLVRDDFIKFDYLLGMDSDNIADMHAIRPDEASAQLQLMLEYSKRYSQRDIPDPYFGNDGFEMVFDMIDDASRGLLEHIRSEHEI